jgi:hypothetical protein
VITLGGILLGYDMIWTDRHNSDGVSQSVLTTIGNGQIIFVQPKFVGRPVTLVANEAQGWIPADIVPQLKYIASLPGEVFDFNFHDLEMFQVAFKHQDAPALELRPLIEGAELGQWYIGTIKLFSV